MLLAADAGVTLVGIGFVAGDALDLSGLDGNTCRKDDAKDCIPRATLGGFGSALTYTGHDNVYLTTPDRGPFDGRTAEVNPYVNRYHLMHMALDMGAPFPNIRTSMLSTTLLKDGNQRLVGSSNAFNAVEPDKTLRFDPEGVRVGKDQTFFVSDEYGPYIYQFSREGYLIRKMPVPDGYLIGTPSADADSAGTSMEIYPNLNTFGRQANRGMEGLAITPDGRFLIGIMQNALIQDAGLSNAVPPGRVGLANRILRMNIETGATQEFVYVMDSVAQGRGVNDIVAMNDHEFLVVERDNRSLVPTPPADPAEPVLKRIYKIDLNKPGLTDVSSRASLPGTVAALAAAGVVTVDKTLFIDMLDPAYKVDATQTLKATVAEKIEALAWGPDLADGRHLLYVLSDNDLSQTLPTRIYAFAIDKVAAKISYQPQQLPKRMIGKGKVDKMLGKN